MATKKGPRSKSKHLLATLVIGKKAPCAFCQRNVDDEITYGKLYAIGDIQCHYFCVLLSCCLIQKGKDEEGLFGFLYDDILAEIERSKKHRCSYCQKGGATLGCCVTQCRKQFHLPCGRQRDAVSLFYGTYKSFCQLHAPKQKIPEHIMAPARARKRHEKSRNLSSGTPGSLDRVLAENQSDESHKKELESVCVICYEQVDGFPTLQTFWPPCCARDAWFHRACLQRMALSAGMHYLKCPLCNDKDSFYEAVVGQGYYVPDRDAAWELEQNAFAEIYERPLSCGADECLCPMGRNHDAETGQWDIKLCMLCGTSGVHAQCAGGARARHVCCACRPAAPDDLDRLADSIEAVILAEQTAAVARRGPVMPSRMSLRRTKQRIAHNAFRPSTSKTDTVVQTELKEPPGPENAGEATKQDTPSSRLDLNLKTPKRPTKTPTGQPNPIPEPVLKGIDNILTPTKLLEQGLSEKIQRMGVREIELDSRKVLERVREQFKKPRPLSEKKRIINNILESLFDNMLKEHPKTKEPIKEWSTPKKCSDIKLEDEESAQENIDPTVNAKTELINDTKSLIPKQVPLDITNESSKTNLEPFIAKKSSGNDLESSEPATENIEAVRSTDEEIKEETSKEEDMEDNSSTSTFELPSEFVAEHVSDDSLSLFETPKKLKTVDIEKDSSLEISANDEVVNVDIFKIDSEANTETHRIDSPMRSPVVSEKCAFKFSPLDKETLEKVNLDLDVESFKSQYLNEVDREFKCSYDHKHKHKHSLVSPRKIRTAIDFALAAYEKEIKSEIFEGNNLKRKSDVADAVEKKKRKKEKRDKGYVKDPKIKLVFSKDETRNEVKQNLDLTSKEKKNAAKKRKKLKKLNKLSMRGIDLSLDATEEEKSKKQRKKLKKMSVSEIDLTVNTTEKDHSEKKHKKIKKNKREIKVKIRWKKEQLRLKITKSESKKVKNENVLKQYILKYSPDVTSSGTVIMKPDNDVVLKRKYIKQEKSPDNLKQTSIQSFFKIKPPEKL